MKLQMHGGMQRRRINLVSLIVSFTCLCCRAGEADYHRAVAITALTQTITHLTKSGRFRQAADREKDIGQLYLHEIHDKQKACQSFEHAADWYAQEDAKA